MDARGSTENQTAPTAQARKRRPRRKRPVLSSGIIPVFQSEQGTLFLLLRAFNYWDFPRGCSNKGESPFQTAIREFHEETAIEKVSFPWGDEFRETPPYARGKIARYYIGSVKTKKVSLLPNPEHGEVEHHEYRWVTYDEARILLAERVRPILDWAAEKIGGPTCPQHLRKANRLGLDKTRDSAIAKDG